jgi:putative transposase
MTLEDMPVQDEMSTSRPGRSGRVPADRRSKKPTVEQDEARAVAELVRVAREQGDALTGPTGLLKKVTAMVLQAALEAEMTEHLGHAKHQVPDAGSNAVADPGQDGVDDAVVNEARNVRNGSRVKTVLTDSAGEVMIRVPRDRAGWLEPVIVARHQCKLGSLDTMVMSLTAKGLTSGEIGGHLQEIYGAPVSKDTICRITDTILEEMHEWATRPLESIYAAIFIDAIVVKVKVKDGQVANRPFYAAIGVTVEGRKDVLGLWAGTPGDGEGAKYWMAVLIELKNRGVADVMFVVCDGLKGLPDSIEAVWPYAIVQTCVIHLLRNSFAADVPQVLGPDRAGLEVGLHRSVAGRGKGPVRRLDRDVGPAVPGVDPTVGERLGTVHTVPSLRRGNTPNPILYQRDRVPQRPLPASGQGPRSLPQRAVRPQMPLPRHP